MILTGKSQYGLPDSFEVSNTSVGFFGVTRCGKTTQELKLFEAANIMSRIKFQLKLQKKIEIASI